jgi:hypothetical protein
MRYRYETVSDQRSVILSSGNCLEASIVLVSDLGELILREEYVPILDLAKELKNWDGTSTFEYNPDGYGDNPMLRFCLTQQDCYDVTTPDTRSSGKAVLLSRREMAEFVQRFCADVLP